MDLAQEIIKPGRTAAMNDTRYSARLRAFEVLCRLKNGAETTITTVALNAAAATQHCERIFGGRLKGVKPRQVV